MRTLGYPAGRDREVTCKAGSLAIQANTAQLLSDPVSLYLIDLWGAEWETCAHPTYFSRKFLGSRETNGVQVESIWLPELIEGTYSLYLCALDPYLRADGLLLDASATSTA